MKNKRWVLAVIALLLSLLIASIPRLHTIESVDASKIPDYPALQEAYHGLCEEYSLYDLQTDDMIQIVTIRNLWGSWERYILPCYSAHLPTIPKAGSTSGHAGLFILAPWSEENLFTNLFRLKVRDFWLYMDTPQNLFVYEYAEVTDANLYPVRRVLHSKLITLEDAIICNRQPTVLAEYSLATNHSAGKKDEPVLTKFTWKYTLRFMGHKLSAGSYTLNVEHILNA